MTEEKQCITFVKSWVLVIIQRHEFHCDVFIYIYYMLVLFIPWPSITGPLPPPQKSSDLLSKHIFFYYPLLSIPLSPLYISSFTLFILFSTHRGTHIKCVFVSAACNYYSSYVALFNFRYCDASIVWSLYYIPSVYLLYCLRAAK